MLRRIVAATMIGALALTSGCAFHNPFAKKAEPVTYEAVVQGELSPEEKPAVDDWYSWHNLE